jgi:hypothetical protein
MFSNRPKTIQIYLPNGNAQGLRIAEITSRTVQATQIPRKKLQAAADREEVRRVGVYFLFGDVGDDATKPPVYVGEAENCFQRLQNHHEQKDFWTTAVTVTSKTRSFTKAHARRLEYDCIRKAREAQRFQLQNTQSPSEPHIPEPMLAELRDNFGTIQTLLSTLGFPILDPLASGGQANGENDQANSTPLLYCRGNGVEATGEYTEDGLVVHEGSEARRETAPSVGEAVVRRRENLRQEGVLEPEGRAEKGALVFRQDHAFNSPSGAAGVILGRSSNGWREWVDTQGRTLDQIERQS